MGLSAGIARPYSPSHKLAANDSTRLHPGHETRHAPWGRACSFSQPSIPRRGAAGCFCSNRMHHTWPSRRLANSSSTAMRISGSAATACLPAGRALVPCVPRPILHTKEAGDAHVRVQFDSVEPCTWHCGWRNAFGERFIDVYSCGSRARVRTADVAKTDAGTLSATHNCHDRLCAHP